MVIHTGGADNTAWLWHPGNDHDDNVDDGDADKDDNDVAALVFILSVFIWDLQCKSHFNRKIMFRVTKSQNMKDKLSFI